MGFPKLICARIGGNPHKEEDALKAINEFKGRLRDFSNSMEKYLKAEPKAEWRLLVFFCLFVSVCESRE